MKSTWHCVCGKPAPRVLLELVRVHVPTDGTVSWTVWCPSCGEPTEILELVDGVLTCRSGPKLQLHVQEDLRAKKTVWNAKTSWNVCKTRTCRGPVEGPGGSVDFIDGGEAHCIECGREYTVYIADSETTPWLKAVRPSRSRS